MRDKSFNDLFVKQLDEYSCGVACLATIANIYGLGSAYTYDAIRGYLKPDPAIGTPTKAMVKLASQLAQFSNYGEDSYHGGIAIARIFDECDHYVVFLCQEGDDVLYYDPYTHALVVKNSLEIDWRSEDEPLGKWSVNFSAIKDNSFNKWQSLKKQD